MRPPGRAAARLLAVILVAFSLGGGSRGPSSPRRRLLVVLLDRSASLENTAVWQAAREAADRLFWNLRQGEMAALVSFDTEARLEIGFTGHPEQLKAALWSGLRPRGRGTAPRVGLERGVELLLARGGKGEIHLISDFQRSAFARSAPDLPAEIHLIAHRVPWPAEKNVRVGPASRGTGPPGGVTIQVPLQWCRGGRCGEDEATIPGEGWWPDGVRRLPAAGNRPELRLVAAPLQGGEVGVVAERLPGDGWPSDDRSFAVLPAGVQPGRAAPGLSSAPGEPVDLGPVAGGGPLVLITPGGRKIRMAGSGRIGWFFRDTGQTGIYRVDVPGREPPTRYLVVAPAPAESVLISLSAGEMRTVSGGSSARTSPGADRGAERRGAEFLQQTREAALTILRSLR
ncbi:MAG: VWA domain-containing protein [Acidobacteriota bacterium]